jgi:hypothetical protein
MLTNLSLAGPLRNRDPTAKICRPTYTAKSPERIQTWLNFNEMGLTKKNALHTLNGFPVFAPNSSQDRN